MKKHEPQNIEQQNKIEDISIKEVERIGLGLRNMQTKADILKRRKRKKRKVIITVVLLLIMIAGIIVYQIKKNEEESTTIESSEDVVAGENQEIILGEISEINGNEMTFTLVEEEESTETESEASGRGDKKSGSAPTDEAQTGETQSIEGKNVQSNGVQMASQNGEDTSQMVDMSNGQMPDMSEMPTDGEASTEGGSQNNQTMPTTMPETKTYRSLGEERTASIPVGTDVVTKLGTTTTFARLAAGDVVQMLTEKVGEEDVIIKMWIVG